MEWNKEKTLYFISLIKERPILWDSSLPEHKNKNIRHDAIEEIANIMNISSKDVNMKWTSLRGQYTREKRKILGARTGSGACAIIKWFAYNEMDSIMSTYVPPNIVYHVSMDENVESPAALSPDTPSTLSPLPPSTPPPTFPVESFKHKSGPPNKKKYSGLYSEAMQTLKAIRESQKRLPSDEDGLNSFASYIVSQVRQFHPRLQTKAKYEINQVMFQLEMENLEYQNHHAVVKKEPSD